MQFVSINAVFRPRIHQRIDARVGDEVQLFVLRNENGQLDLLNPLGLEVSEFVQYVDFFFKKVFLSLDFGAD